MTARSFFPRAFLIAVSLLIALPSCSGVKPDADQSYPQDPDDVRKNERGKITGEDGLVMGGDSGKKDKDAGRNPLGVNSFLWRASLDTLSFLPIAAADPWGGTILTDWYEDTEAPGERYKVNVLILDRQLRADSLKISTFRQKKDAKGNWMDAPTDPKLGRKLEDTVLTRARQMRVAQLGY
jgi:hypothetical protein